MATLSPAPLRKIFDRVKRKTKKLVQKSQGKQFVHFLHIGKTGGSAIKYALRQQRETAAHVLYLHPHRVKLRDVPAGEKVIFFVRDPITRFVSGFYSRQRQGQPRIFSPWVPDEKVAFERFATSNELASALSSPDEQLRARAREAMTSIRHVKDSYWNWFESEQYFMSRASDIYFVGFQESLTPAFDALRSRLALKDIAGLPDDDVNAHRNPKHLDKNLDETSLDNLREWYREDYRFLGLCKQLIERDGCGYVE